VIPFTEERRTRRSRFEGRRASKLNFEWTELGVHMRHPKGK
jgi:hypothetical protein